MDWQHKFSSIICETDANLDRIKNKMNYRRKEGVAVNKTFDDEFYSSRYSSPLKSASRSMVHYPVMSTPKDVHWLPSDNLENISSQPDNAAMYSLYNKLEKQNRTIEQLTNLVQVMESERHEYKQQIAELKYEVRDLSRHVSDKGRDKRLEHQIKLLKNDISGEIQNIRDQVKNYRTRVDSSQVMHEDETYFRRSQNKDLSDIRQIMRDELDYVKTDLDKLRSRLGSLETQVLTRTGDRNTTGLHNVMERLHDNQRLIHETKEIIPDVISDKLIDRCQMKQLRLNVSALKQKLDSVEERLCQSLTPPLSDSSTSVRSTRASSTVRRKSKKTIYDVNIDDDDELDELCLSDDEFDVSDELVSDLDDLVEDGAPELTSTRRKKFSRKKAADLDFDGLNLSDPDDSLVNSDIDLNSDEELISAVDDL